MIYIKLYHLRQNKKLFRKGVIKIMKVTKKTLDMLCETKLFTGVSRKNISSLLESQEKTIEIFKKGDVIYSTEKYEARMGFIIRGAVNVIKPATNVTMNTLKKGEFFGAASLYSQKQSYIANLVAATETKVLFIDKETVGVLMLREQAMTLNFVSYLTETLYYLNAKIDAFTGGTAESRLAGYLIEAFGGYRTMQLKTPYTKLAISLNIGRASLYRAFDTFIDGGIIEKDGKFIRLLDEDKLKEYAK